MSGGRDFGSLTAHDLSADEYGQALELAAVPEHPECSDCGERHEEGIPGACPAEFPTCQGWGYVDIDPPVLGKFDTKCPICGGSGLKDVTEEIHRG